MPATKYRETDRGYIESYDEYGNVSTLADTTGLGTADEDEAELEAMLHRANTQPGLVKILESAKHALRSYQHCNSSPELAEEIADACDAALKAATPDKGE